jgi:hypothetical protein
MKDINFAGTCGVDLDFDYNPYVSEYKIVSNDEDNLNENEIGVEIIRKMESYVRSFKTLKQLYNDSVLVYWNLYFEGVVEYGKNYRNVGQDVINFSRFDVIEKTLE